MMKMLDINVINPERATVLPLELDRVPPIDVEEAMMSAVPLTAVGR